MVLCLPVLRSFPAGVGVVVFVIARWSQFPLSQVSFQDGHDDIKSFADWRTVSMCISNAFSGWPG